MPNIEQMRSELQDIAGLPTDRPHSLPGIFYTDPAYFEWEKATVLREGWHSLGRADEIPDAGDYFTVQLLNEPLLVVRGDDTEIRVLANVCRHRGMPIAQGAGNSKRFICSYHAWAYGRDGKLLRAARMKNAGFDAKQCRLPEFRVVVWMGFIYCTLSQTAPPLLPDYQGLETLVASYQPDQMRIAHVAQEDWKTNWKCLVENFMEGYHLSVVHPQTLHGYTPTGLAKKSASGQGYTSYRAVYPEGIDARGIGAVGLSATERHQSALFSVFPTQVASISASLFVALSIFPLAAGLIRVKWTVSTYGDDLDAETVAARIALWQEVNREDREKLERMQVALGSETAHSGPLAGDDYEGTIRDFQFWLAQQDVGQAAPH